MYHNPNDPLQADSDQILDNGLGLHPHSGGGPYDSPHGEHLNFHSTPNPYTTIDEFDGWIRRHQDGDGGSGDWVGKVAHNNVYNIHDEYLGHAGDDGKVYDSQNHVVGWVDNQGHVFNGSGVEVSATSHGVVGAAAYLLCVYQGNVP